jgi:hypothetical protein
MVNAYLGIFLKDGKRKTVKYLADDIETAEKELKKIATLQGSVLEDVMEV